MPWLTLTDRHPIIMQFDILPLVDIGGTLVITMSLQIDKVNNIIATLQSLHLT
jgi:hypothetical protein